MRRARRDASPREESVERLPATTRAGGGDDDGAATLRPDHVPEHVWTLLQGAGELAAQRLHDLLASLAFSRRTATEQTKLIELALTRAYGQPVKREIRLDLSNADADAVAASLSQITGRLPEYRDITSTAEDSATPPQRRRKGSSDL